MNHLIDSLNILGIKTNQEIIYNPSYQQLRVEELNPSLEGYEKGVLTNSGAINVLTGQFTGRSPKDKYIVLDESTKDSIWWTSEQVKNDNKAINQDIWQSLKNIATKQLSNKRLFVVDAFCGANKNTRLCVRFVTEVAWQAHFVTNMFIRPSAKELATFKADFVVLNAAKATNPNWQQQGLNSKNFVAFNLKTRMQIIGGTWYGGEMKKGLFSVMNYYLPKQNIASMHCAANMDNNNNVAIFFGLSGTGKTTLSADPNLLLIGDDEHGWDDDGIFNFEGGCYAKTINLSKQQEPDIYQAIKENALLENTVVNDDGSVDYASKKHTENTRVSYPIYHINNIVKPSSKGGHAKKIIFLTADAFGVLPAVSLLSSEQAQYYFLSGFTAKVAGTERGINKATPTFSACFGAAFLLRHPNEYAQILTKRSLANNAKFYLVNTGWNGLGKRIKLSDTRKIINAILNGEVNEADTENLPIFNLKMSKQIAGVDAQILDPRNHHIDKKSWQTKAKELAKLFAQNFAKFNDTESYQTLTQAGPKY